MSSSPAIPVAYNSIGEGVLISRMPRPFPVVFAPTLCSSFEFILRPYSRGRHTRLSLRIDRLSESRECIVDWMVAPSSWLSAFGVVFGQRGEVTPCHKYVTFIRACMVTFVHG